MNDRPGDPLVTHPRCYPLADKESGPHVDRHYRVEAGLACIQERLVARQPGAVHQNVENGQFSEHRPDLRDIGNIQRHRVQYPPVFCGECGGGLQRLAITGGDPHLRPGVGQRDGAGEPQSSGAARHQGALAVQAKGGHLRKGHGLHLLSDRGRGGVGHLCLTVATHANVGLLGVSGKALQQ